MLGPAAGILPRLGRASLLLTDEFESLSPVSRTRPAQTRLKYELHREAQLIASAARTKQCAGLLGRCDDAGLARRARSNPMRIGI
jgi:hypothetical protein